MQTFIKVILSFSVKLDSKNALLLKKKKKNECFKVIAVIFSERFFSKFLWTYMIVNTLFRSLTFFYVSLIISDQKFG